MSACTAKPILKKTNELFLFFLLTSIIGWFYEVFLEVVIYRWGYSNRGVLTGPYCPIYGVGAVVLLLCLYPLKKQNIKIGSVSITPILVFVGIVAITTAIELAASYIMEWITGDWMWDYTRFTPNFQGRIALNPSIRFSVGGMAFLYLLYPLHQKLMKKCRDKTAFVISLIFGIIFLVDCLSYISNLGIRACG